VVNRSSVTFRILRASLPDSVRSCLTWIDLSAWTSAKTNLESMSNRGLRPLCIGMSLPFPENDAKRCAKRQMRRTERDAHVLLEVRTCVSNGDWRSMASRRFPGMQTEQETDIEKKAA
jgi:hypothetical protein